MALLELFLFHHGLVLSFELDIVSELHGMHFKHTEQWVFAIFVLAQHDLLFILDLMQLSFLGSTLISQGLFQQSLLLIVLLGLTTTLFLEWFFKQCQKLVCGGGRLRKQ